MKRTVLLCAAGALLAAGLVGPSHANRSWSPTLRALPPPVLEAHVTHAVPADTLRRRVQGGEPLIMTLPAILGDRPVASYRFLRAPALSWLVDRSMLWRTRPDDVGEHVLLVGAALADAPPDTLAILVTVTQ